MSTTYTIYADDNAEQLLARGVNEETTRKILTNVGPARCMVYASCNKYDDPADGLDGVQWLTDNPETPVKATIVMLREAGYRFLMRRGGADQLKETLASFKVRNISSLKPEQYDSAYAAMQQILSLPPAPYNP